MQCKGFTLVEVLVALTLLALTTTGIVSSQLRTASLAAYQNAHHRAGFLAMELAARIQLNPSTQYSGLVTSSSFPVNCHVSTCNGIELANYDIAVINSLVTSELPQGNLDIVSCNEGSTCIRISWSGQANQMECGEAGICEFLFDLVA